MKGTDNMTMKRKIKTKKDNWFDSHVVIMGVGFSEKDKEFIKQTIIKKCAAPIAKLGEKEGS
jgi:hypothetical protein